MKGIVVAISFPGLFTTVRGHDREEVVMEEIWDTVVLSETS